MNTRFFSIAFLLLVFSTLAGCSSPEEKAAAHVANGETYLAENKMGKARVEFANALQLNQNLPQAWYGLARVHQARQQWRKAYNILTRIRDTNPTYMDARVLLTRILLAGNQIDLALEDARDILELSPDDARAHSIMASVQARLGNGDAARESIERALALDPANPEALLMQANLLVDEKQYDRALQVLDSALQANPDNVSAHVMQLGIFSDRGDADAMELTYRTMVRRFPDNRAFRQALVRHYVEIGKLDEAEKLLQDKVRQEPDSIDARLELVDFKSDYRSLNDAIALIGTYIANDGGEYRYRFELARLYLRNGQQDRAIAEYRGIIDDDGLQANGLEARNDLARIYLRATRLEESRALVDEVLTHDKNNEGALLLRSRFDLAEGDYNEAVNNLRTVLRDKPDSLEALTLLGRAQAGLGADNLAIEYFSRAFDRDPAIDEIANRLAAALVRIGQPAQADEVLTRSIGAGNRSVEAVKLLTEVKLMLEDWGRAEELARQLEKVDGEEAVSQQVLGLVYQRREQIDESIAAFRRAHELNPVSAEPMVALVQTYLRTGQTDKARAFLDSVVADNPSNTAAHRLLGQLSLIDKDKQAAIGHFRDAIESNAAQEGSYLSLASIYLRDRQLPQAESILQAGFDEIPDSPRLLTNLALVVERRGEVERAIELYEALLAANPNIAIARNNLASLLTDHRDDDASHERARQLAAEFRDSKIALFRDTYAWASVRSGLYLQEAIVILGKIVDENPSVALYHYHLGEAYRKTGSTFDARRHLRRAIELADSESPFADDAKKSLELVSQ